MATTLNEKEPTMASLDINKDPILNEKQTSSLDTPDSVSTTSQASLPPSEPIPAPIATPPAPSFRKGYRFWFIFLAICVATLLVAIDLSILSTALPTISSDLNTGASYVWIANAYVLSSTAVQPLYGQTANIFGRRSLTLFAVTAFIVGSALCGWANSTALLIAGRTVQGVGGGGIITLGEIITCDLVPLRERGKYTGLVSATYAIGTVLGPILGGTFAARISWRWIFWINLPIGAVALALVAAFLRLKYRREGTLRERLGRVDVPGNVLLIAAVSAVLVPLSTAGTSTPWSSWRTLVPLVLGLLGLIAFGLLETSGRIPEPTMPRSLFGNRTSITVLVMGFVHGLLLIGVTFFLPIYWQAVRAKSPLQSGINALPISFSIAPAAGVAGVIMARTGRYRVFHFAGFALMAITIGCFTLYDEHTSTAMWVLLQFIFGLGCGIVYSTMIPPLLAAIDTQDMATAAATWSFMRSFGQIWGVAIPSAVFNDKVNRLVAERLAQKWPEVAALLVNGGAYEKATKKFIEMLGTGEVRAVVSGIYVDALKVVWYTLMAWAIVGVPLSFGVKSLELSTVLDDEFGIEERKKHNDAAEANNV